MSVDTVASTLTHASSLGSSHKTIALNSLSLNAFRNYEYARIEVDSRPIILAGKNGSGKTNIIEAISLLLPGRGLRKAKLGDLNNVHLPHSPWAVVAQLEGLQGDTKIGIGHDTQSLEIDKRLLKIDDKPIKSQAQLSQHVSMVWLTPQMDQLFNESGTVQRRFLDRIVYNFDAEHASRINEYEFSIRERNRLLQQGQHDAPWLAALEQTMAETGCAIATARLDAVARLNKAIEASDLTFPKARMTLSGMVEDQIQQEFTALEVEETLKRFWHNARREDGVAGRTLAGTHRTQLEVTHIDKNMPASACSTGEQKALLLSITLGQVRASRDWKGVIPILLLDEVISHLDASRKLELFKEICQIRAQTWMTGTDAELFAEFGGDAQLFHVDHGSITT